MSLTATDIRLYRLCETLTEALIYLMLIFSPWAFGTTQPWAMATMNVAGYVLGLLLVVKFCIRARGYRPARWDVIEIENGNARGFARFLTTRTLTRVLAWLTFAILLYCFISALNARATYLREEAQFVYHPAISWLPHSYDSIRSWKFFQNYLALAFAFWAVRDWLLGMSAAEARTLRQSQIASSVTFLGSSAIPEARESRAVLPGRLRRLLWVLCVNGALLAIESIVQRLSGTGKLLWLVETTVNKGPESQLGPFAYRSNGAQWLNLIWPICLGFWLSLMQLRRKGDWAHFALLPCAVVMAVAAIMSLSRAGAIVAFGILVLALVIQGMMHFLFEWRGSRKHGRKAFGIFSVVTAAAIFLGVYFGWETLGPRMEYFDEGVEYREEMFDRARGMGRDYPVFGTGAGTFEPVFQLYRLTSETYWPAQLHNDWLETLITFGWLGSIMIFGALAVALIRWFAPGGIYAGRRFMVMAWLAVAGCLVEARFDFPFQIYSIVFLFLVICAFLSVVSRRAWIQ